jgi:carbonic anhydrase
VLVLGHTKCGAVQAAVAEAEETGALGQLLSRFQHVVQAVAGLPPDQKVAAAVKKSVELAVTQLTTISPVLVQAVQEGRVKIIGAVYQIEDGRVIFN